MAGTTIYLLLTKEQLLMKGKEFSKDRQSINLFQVSTHLDNFSIFYS